MIEELPQDYNDLSRYARLNFDELPVGVPLGFMVFDANGTPLLGGDAVLPSPPARDFLFAHFQPHKHVPRREAGLPPPSADPQPGPATLDDMRLKIGTTLHLRLPREAGFQRVPSCRVIGVAPNHSLFVTPPAAGNRPVRLLFCEAVEMLYFSEGSLFHFTCTVKTVQQAPFDYLVLSAPVNIRRLRPRAAVRARTKLVARHCPADSVNFASLGIVRDICVAGLSLSTPQPLGQPGDRVRVAFRVQALNTAVDIDTTGVVRNVREDPDGPRMTATGLEFEHLATREKFALQCFVNEQEQTSI